MQLSPEAMLAVQPSVGIKQPFNFLDVLPETPFSGNVPSPQFGHPYNPGLGPVVTSAHTPKLRTSRQIIIDTIPFENFKIFINSSNYVEKIDDGALDAPVIMMFLCEWN